MSMARICVNLSIHTLKKKTLNQFSHLPPFKATLLSFWQNLINFPTYTPSIAKVPHFFLSSLENELVSFYLKTKKQKKNENKQISFYLSLVKLQRSAAYSEHGYHIHKPSRQRVLDVNTAAQPLCPCFPVCKTVREQDELKPRNSIINGVGKIQNML